MAARKKAVKKRSHVKTLDGLPGVIRFKEGFPEQFRDYINAQFPDGWNLELEIKEFDDGEGDDGSVEVPDRWWEINGQQNGKGKRAKAKRTRAKKPKAKRR